MPATVLPFKHYLAKAVVVHQPRERSIRCSGCGTPNQWEAQHGYCNHCIAAGLLKTNCRCAEGLAAADARGQQ